MAFKNIYCIADVGDNNNGGTDENAVPTFTGTGTYFDPPDRRIVVDGNPDLSGISVGQGINYFVTSDNFRRVCHIVTEVDNTGKVIHINQSAYYTSSQVSDGDPVTFSVGGAWQGPVGSRFPFDQGTQNGLYFGNAIGENGESGLLAMKASVPFTPSGTLTPHSTAASWVVTGYTSVVGDRGKATLDFTGVSADAGYLFDMRTLSNSWIVDLVIKGSLVASSTGFIGPTTGTLVKRVSVSNCTPHGFYCQGTPLTECEAYECGNLVSNHGCYYIPVGQTATLIRCVARNTRTYCVMSVGDLEAAGCIFESDGNRTAIYSSGTGTILLAGCDVNNVVHVIQKFNLGFTNMENCNFGNVSGLVMNYIGTSHPVTVAADSCGYWNVNSIDNLDPDLDNYIDINPVTYTAEPWTDATAGNYLVDDPAAIGTGRGSFLQLNPWYTQNTVNAASRGAASPVETTGGGGGIESHELSSAAHEIGT